MHSLKYQSILITGGAGFMGSNFIDFLLSANFKGSLVNLDALTYAGNMENLKDFESDPRHFFVRGDVCDGSLLNQLNQKYQFDLIVHFAAESHVDRSIDNPKIFLDTNVYGTQTLLELVKKNPHIHMHLISTDEVYGDLKDEGFFTETSPYAPSSPYAASKAAADHLTKAYARTYGISTTISHACNNFGPNQDKEKLIPKMIDRCIKGEEIPLYGDGQQIREWLYVKDHSKAIYQLLLNGKRGEVYNIGSSFEQSNLEVVKAIAMSVARVKEMSYKALTDLITFVSDRPGHDFRYAMDSSKAKQELGWVPEIEFTKGLDLTIQSMSRDEKKNSLCNTSAT